MCFVFLIKEGSVYMEEVDRLSTGKDGVPIHLAALG